MPNPVIETPAPALLTNASSVLVIDGLPSMQAGFAVDVVAAK